MVIQKFGGTSVGTPEGINKVIEIVTKSKKEVGGVVVSAFDGVTDRLVEMATLAGQGNRSFLKLYKEMSDRHIESAEKLLHSQERRQNTLQTIKQILSDLQSILQGVFLVKEASPKTLDAVMSFGERIAAFIVAQTFIDRGVQAQFVDARNLVRTNNVYNNAKVDFPVTNENIREFYASHRDGIKIITGFIGSTDRDETTTLGRGGSDYTASIFGAAVGAEGVEIWTDVDGVKTADSKKVPNAFSINRITHEEAMEMSHFGAKVIYPSTMVPAMERDIPLVIRNTFNPEFEGTMICRSSSDQYPIKGISSISDVVLLLVEGSGMVGVPGTAMRLFSALARHTINVILITQASSEHTICLGIIPHQIDTARAAIEEEFNQEIKEKLIEPVIVEQDLSVVAVVGENMRKTSGIAGTLFSALGNSNINVIAIAQGSSERNISVVVARKDEVKALQVMHKAFFGR